MSKYVKDLITRDLAKRLDGVEDAILVNVIGMNANNTVQLRRELRDKNIQLMVVKTSLARRAAGDSTLARAFEGAEGALALVWGSEDFISLTKEITRIDKEGKYEGFATRGGVMDGEQLSADRVKEISKWPNRQEQLSLLVGQILSPGAQLSSQLLGPGGALASQIEKKSEPEGEDAAAEEAPAA